MIGDGAELLLLIPSYAPLVGSIVIPVLGAVPDGMMVLCSGMGPDPQTELSTGIGALAGSTIMLLTLPWLLAVWSGRVGIENGVCTYKSVPKLPENLAFNPFKTGVLVGEPIKQNAKIMLLTATTYFVIQIPAFFYDPFQKSAPKVVSDEASHEYWWAVAGLVLCCAWFVFYIVLMVRGNDSNEVLQDAIVQRTVEGIRCGEITLPALLASVGDEIWTALKEKKDLKEGLINTGSKLLEQVSCVRKVLACFFTLYDTSKDALISYDECRQLLKELNGSLDENVQKQIFAKIGKDKDLGFDQFIDLIVSFALSESTKANVKVAKSVQIARKYMEEETAPEDDQEADEEDMPSDLADLSPAEQRRRLLTRAGSKMFLGTALVLIFTDPMCDLLTTMGAKWNISSFYVSFVLAPLASNASELVAAMRMASKKTKATMVNALSSLEGAAIMNNTFCLGIFMLLIVWKSLVWTFAAETISILFVELVIGLIVFFCKNQNLIHACCIFLCYPASLLLVMILEAAGLD